MKKRKWSTQVDSKSEVVVNHHSEPTESASTSFTMNNNGDLRMFGLLKFGGK